MNNNIPFEILNLIFSYVPKPETFKIMQNVISDFNKIKEASKYENLDFFTFVLQKHKKLCKTSYWNVSYDTVIVVYVDKFCNFANEYEFESDEYYNNVDEYYNHIYDEDDFDDDEEDEFEKNYDHYLEYQIERYYNHVDDEDDEYHIEYVKYVEDQIKKHYS